MKSLEILKNAPAPVREFVNVALDNARKAWDDDPSEDFVLSLLYVHEESDGWHVSDNYERFFSGIYRYHEGQWYVRGMYSDTPERPCSHGSMMSTASILYTG